MIIFEEEKYLYCEILFLDIFNWFFFWKKKIYKFCYLVNGYFVFFIEFFRSFMCLIRYKLKNFFFIYFGCRIYDNFLMCFK